MAQGSKGATEYWNEYTLIASQTGMDDATLTYHLMTGFKTELQDAWGMDGSDSQDPQFVATWGIKKETKMAAIKHNTSWDNKQWNNRIVRNLEKSKWDLSTSER